MDWIGQVLSAGIWTAFGRFVLTAGLPGALMLGSLAVAFVFWRKHTGPTSWRFSLRQATDASVMVLCLLAFMTGATMLVAREFRGEETRPPASHVTPDGGSAAQPGDEDWVP